MYNKQVSPRNLSFTCNSRKLFLKKKKFQEPSDEPLIQQQSATIFVMALKGSTTGSSAPHYVSTEGNNTGAALLMNGCRRTAGTASNCCCINIYVNNNIQGVTNSVLFGSKVAMRDPGARLSFRQNLGRDKDGKTTVMSKKVIGLQSCILLLALTGFILVSLFIIYLVLSLTKDKSGLRRDFDGF